MVFSSAFFLFFFLPWLLALSWLTPRAGRNALLLAASLVFYAAGEGRYVVVLLSSIAMNYGFGLAIDRLNGRTARAALILAVVANVASLGWFKYANFAADNVNALLGSVGLPAQPLAPVHLPLGISFFTFHALSYVIDVYRREVRALLNPIDFALYISFFPQSIAGPIVRYHDVAAQLTDRVVTLDGFGGGVRRFVVGLAKKMLIANVVAVPADAVFGLPPAVLTPGLAWLGAVCYALQIYFDFSGYSDMASGLAGMFGFRFPENFDAPYRSRSVTEFWRRWHMSLSSWYRDYLYIPLGGNRGGPRRTYFNLLTVFVLCGLWHGASWTFVLWGLYHGAFLVLERVGLGRRLERLPGVIRHGYALAVVLVGWVLFRATTVTQAGFFLARMTGVSGATEPYYGPAVFLTPVVMLALGVGCLSAISWPSWLPNPRTPDPRTPGPETPDPRTALPARPGFLREIAWSTVDVAGTMALFAASALVLATGTHNPFIYFRF